ncbi:hypothetical protein K661_01584 [Piscirickettsia salmonis LF-89 = ATCC VR-1361]|nr:hypothetical protein K661_01584 [Piscirickettsia salmonis LF-89 = ATCC VR-1361]
MSYFKWQKIKESPEKLENKIPPTILYNAAETPVSKHNSNLPLSPQN